MPAFTGLENWAIPLLSIIGCATLLATSLTVARFLGTTSAGHPIAKASIALAILICGTISNGAAWFGATLLNPLQNHFWISAAIWAASTALPAIFCAQPSKK